MREYSASHCKEHRLRLGQQQAREQQRLDAFLHDWERRRQQETPFSPRLLRPSGHALKLYLSGDAANTSPFPADGCVHRLDGINTEEACFETVCDWADEARNTPVALLVSAHQEEESLLNVLRGIYRGAVYTPLSLIWYRVRTPRQAERLTELGHRAFCELSEEAREFNGYPQKGLLLDTPLLAFSDSLPRSLDLLCFDVPRLFHLLSGCRRGQRSEELQKALEQRLAARLAEETKTVYLAEPELFSNRLPLWAEQCAWDGFFWQAPLSERSARKLEGLFGANARKPNDEKKP